MVTRDPVRGKGRSKWASRRKGSRPTAISTSQEDWIKTSQPSPDSPLPLLIEPQLAGVDLIDWTRAHTDSIEEALRTHGGLLFRGFGLEGEEDFHRFLDALQAPLVHYTEGATPRTQVSGKVYTSTEFPSDQAIALHNELSYVTSWPMKIFFFCVTPATEQGETPIADVRRVFERLEPEVRDPFLEKGWMLVRNFREGLGRSWQHAYRVTSREELEEYFQQAEIDWEWRGEDHLRTQQVRPAVARHVETGETAWFNHIAFWHASTLEPELRRVMEESYGEEGLPYNTYYGDGAAIDDEVVARLRQAYDAETVVLPWQQGDLMMLDNLLVAHGRRPFVGPRRILTAMAEPCSDRNL